MLVKWLSKLNWRRLRLKIWKKRLERELANTMSRVAWNPSITIRLQISWAPFYNGAAWFNPTRNVATILLQLPYDQFLTEEELNVMRNYDLPLRSLPYFILNHEFYHLLDTLPDTTEAELRHRVKKQQRLAQLETNYRNLSFEQEADRFAYRCYREKIGEAC